MKMNEKRTAREDEPRREYDFRHGVRGKYVRRFRQASNVVILEPDLTEEFRSAKAVNEALRGYLHTRKSEPRHTAKLIQELDIPASLLLDFFVTFARFEYALKACGYTRIRDNGIVEVDWGAFIAFLERVDPQEIEPVVDVGRDLLAKPPKRLVSRDDQVSWQDVSRSNETEIRFLLDGVKRARNNLFHGGKFLTSPTPKKRNAQVVEGALAVLEAVLNVPSALTLRRAFEETPPDPPR